MTGYRRSTWNALFAAMASVFLIAVLSFTAVSLFALRNTAYSQTRENLKQFTHATANYLETRKNPLARESLREFTKSFGSEPDFRVSVILKDGTVIADSNADPETLENHSDRPEIIAALGGTEASATRFSASLGKRLLYYAIPFEGAVLRLAVTVDYIDTASGQIMKIIFAAAFVIFLITLALSILLTRGIIVPLKKMEDAITSYADGVLEFSFDTGRYPLEIAKLAETFSLMGRTLKEKIETLDRRKTETDAILTGMNDALIVFDSQGYVERVNKAAEDLFHFSAADAEGLPLIQAVRNTDIVDFALHPGKDETERTIELRTGLNEGNRYLLAKSGGIENSGSRLLVFNDITRLKRLERIRKDFVANVSHELKTPVTSIQGFIETLKDGALEDPETARKFLTIMEGQSARLGAIIEDLLVISRLEQNDETGISKEIVTLSSVLDGVKNLCEEYAAKKNARLSYDAPEDLTWTVNPGLLEQAIVNLVQNAVKYGGENGTVTVTARTVKDPVSAQSKLSIEVKDDGPGIPARYIERIFERFYRIDKGRSRDQGGTGLGLSIVRHIALAHGGTVSVSSVEGEGSVFTLLLP